MITNIQYEVNQFFNELDKALPANHPLIVKYGPADTFRELIEDIIEDARYAEDSEESVSKLKEDLEETEEELKDLKTEIEDVIDILEAIEKTDATEDIMEEIKTAIKDLKFAI
jgi:DNA repair exonuclease SbcCD ATPase subunit